MVPFGDYLQEKHIILPNHSIKVSSESIPLLVMKVIQPY